MRVGVTDLERLPALHALLAALSNPAAAIATLEPLCAAMPCLAARLVFAARRAGAGPRPLPLRRALAVLGNHGLESVLLELLEDLTVLRADVDDSASIRVSR